MIFEAIQHILTPARKEVKALGYVREAIAIEARYTRCRTAWAAHLKKCHHHIMAAAERLAPNSTVMIIGSGALHDVPMAALSAYSLILVDIVHLPKVRRYYRNDPKIHFMEQDITGLVQPMHQNGAVSGELPSLPKADLVISLNILSQLPLNLIKYARKQSTPLPNDFARSVMAGHLILLKTIAPHVLIIGDMERHYKKDTMLVETEFALPDIGLPAPSETWPWHIAPKGELDKDISLTHQVGCWLL
ncbi:hypothetical protein MNBD_ALPHA02-1839 [hydrothermal vent metagenome]|uniref:Uncharacterized protein n=1 Tax=hydrothermal vent metagenome TaxID=652676 RepID=A0A3B0R9E5_9ZZZZ